MGTINIRLVTAIVTVSLLAASPFKATAAPGVISDTPLFLSSAVQPNIFFIVDDSGSMGWEVLKSNGALVAHGTGTNSGNMDFSPNDTNELRELCRGYNVMAYNPAFNYAPWAGEDEDGGAYTSKTLTTALNNPFDNDNLDNLESHFYTIWTDNGDGVYQSGECPDDFNAIDTSNGGTISEAECEAAAGCVSVDDLSAAEQVNYANWYSYYRKREYVAKKALSELIIRSTERMGLGTLNQNTPDGADDFKGFPIADIDDITTPINTTAQTAKSELMEQLFRIHTGESTPLRRALEDAGEYYRDGNFGNLFGGDTPDDPILSLAEGGACQQNFTVLLSDGFWNGGDPAADNADGDSSSAWDGGAYADAVSNTLADVAMKYYETDLDTSLPAQVKAVPGRDSNTQQHMNTYTVAFGVNGTLTADPVDPAAAFAWPTPVANTTTTIDDMRHAAFNGRGMFLSAGDPQELISGLVGAISDISDVTGTAAAVSFNSTVIDTGSLVFQASFNTEGWYGDLTAITIDPDDPSVRTTAWSAGGKLASRDLGATPRKIITFNGTSGIDFDFPLDYTNPTAATEMALPQILDMLANAPFPAATTVPGEITANQQYGEDLVDFLRGDHSNEVPNGQGFRDRVNRRLGDIINSSPSFVGTPNTAYPNNLEATPYSSFVTTWASRSPRVYVGANDGMLHAFDQYGVEQFAYVPGSVYSAASGQGLHTLAEPDYTHRYYVDLSPKTADVYFGSGWKTVLVGGMRAGGQGIFALDITNPGAITKDNLVLWEYSHADLGYTFSDIQIGRLHNGRWAAIFGNGYNASGDGAAKLFIKYLDNAAPQVEILDTGIGTSVGGDCSNPSSDCNGMSTPALADLNGDGIIDRIYAGDLHGNMWVADVSDGNASNWDFAFSDGSGPRPLFQACLGSLPCAVNDRQPITAKPDLTRHPYRSQNSTSPNILAVFGTGQYITASDNSSTGQQSVYGVWDGGWSGSSALDRSDLVSQTLSIDPTSGNRTLTSNSVNYAGSGAGAEYGWYIDLNDSSAGTGAMERVVTDPVVIGDIAFLSTFIPSTTVCAEGGEGWRLTIDMLTGGLPTFAVVDINNDGDFSNDPVIAGQKFSGIQVSPKLIATGDEGVLYRFSPEADRVKARDSQSENRTSWTILEY